MLGQSDIERIHRTSMQVLAEIGVLFPNQEALAIFEKHGVKVDGQKVFLTEDQAMEAIAQAPAQFTIHARNSERNVLIGDGVPVLAPGYGAPFIVDLDVGKRPATMDDYHKLAKLAHALPNQDLSGHLMAEPADMPPKTVHLQMLHASMLHSDKPFIGSAEGSTGARHTMEMASILFGEKVGERPLTIGLINSLSPLGYSSEMLEALMVYAHHRQPVIVAALSMAGSTGPITLAGVLVHQNAELLAGITLTQLINPGTPVVYGSTSTNLDMKTGGLIIGGPELSMMIGAHADLCRYYGLPSRSGGALTDSHTPDAQAGYESMFSLMTTFQSGIDVVLQAGGILSSYLSFSYEKFVLDDEICGLVRHWLKGIPVNEETLAFPVIAQAGPGGNYMMEMHTLDRCRTEFWQPAVSSRDGIESWMAAGRPDAAHRARQRWQKLVAEHQDPPLDPIIARQLRAFVDEQ
ncbi:MAG: trimethylamine methyltransferase family protein [Anaerolineales bacterium]|nr:trimethylamine methyltransferase family protein [Anaerolineales bacterium]